MVAMPAMVWMSALTVAAQVPADTGVTFPARDARQAVPHNTAFDVVQDTEGFLWIGTHDGLARFDGQTFQSFRHDPGRSDSLSHDTVRKVVPDRDRYVWVRTGVGLDRHDRVDGRFRHYTITVDHLLKDRSGRLLVASASDVRRYDPATDTFAVVASLSSADGVFEGDSIWGACASADGSTWWSTAGGTLFRVDAAARVTATSLPVRDAIVLTEDADGRLWIGHRDGLSIFDPRAGRLVEHAPFRGIAGPVLSMHRHTDGRAWVAGAGLYQVSPDAQTVTAVSLGADPLTTPISAVLVDREGLLWLATPRGIRAHNPYAKQWEHITTPGLTVMAAEHSAHRLWLGTLDAGVWGVSPTADPQGAAATIPARTPCDARVWSLLPETDTTMWVGSDRGLCRWSPSGAQFVALPVDAPTAAPATFVLKRDDTGAVWAGTTAGLFRLPPGGNRAERIAGVGDERDGRINIEGLLAVGGGIVWIGTSRSDIHRVDTRTRETRYFPLGDASAFLGSEGFWSLAEVGDGRLWLGSDRGLFLFDPATASIAPVDEARGVPRMPVYAIVRDEQGSLWFSTSNGLWRHDNPLTATRSTALVRHYTTSDGLPFAEFNRRAAAVGKDGWLAFGGMGGLVRFRPASFRDNPYPPPVHIMAVERSRFDGPPVPAVITNGSVDLSPGDAGFVVSFTAPTFSDAHRAVLNYRMDGIDPDWIAAGTERRARYSALPPGRYTFRVRAANADGVWNLEGASLTMVVPTPWWATTWFRTVATGAVILAFGVSLRQVATRRLRRRVQALELDQRIRTERERISRDLHDHVGAQVTTMLAAIELTGLTAAQGDLARVQSGLVDLRDDAQRTMTQLRETVWSLRHDHVTIADLAAQIRDDLALRQRVLEHPQLHAEAEGALSAALGAGQGLHLFRITQEAVSNAIRHASAQHVRVTLDATAGVAVRLVIQDDGVFQTASIPHVGSGLLNIRARAEEIGARIEIHGLSTGTTIVVVLSLAGDGS